MFFAFKYYSIFLTITTIGSFCFSSPFYAQENLFFSGLKRRCAIRALRRYYIIQAQLKAMKNKEEKKLKEIYELERARVEKEANALTQKFESFQRELANKKATMSESDRAQEEEKLLKLYSECKAAYCSGNDTLQRVLEQKAHLFKEKKESLELAHQSALKHLEEELIKCKCNWVEKMFVSPLDRIL